MKKRQRSQQELEADINYWKKTVVLVSQKYAVMERENWELREENKALRKKLGLV